MYDCIWCSSIVNTYTYVSGCWPFIMHSSSSSSSSDATKSRPLIFLWQRCTGTRLAAGQSHMNMRAACLYLQMVIDVQRRPFANTSRAVFIGCAAVDSNWTMADIKPTSDAFFAMHDEFVIASIVRDRSIVFFSSVALLRRVANNYDRLTMCFLFYLLAWLFCTTRIIYIYF